MSKAADRAARIERARQRPASDRAAVAMRAIMKPAFGRKLAPFDPGRGAPEKIRLQALEEAALRLLGAEGFFVDGLEARAMTHPILKGQIMMTVVPIPPLIEHAAKLAEGPHQAPGESVADFIVRVKKDLGEQERGP